ncbi:hypothetical protein MM300_21680 [Evansella sp. LMS18]|uniref:CBO0543 family protein n=1 Tax=Evansella sp. LMS18 TaxID=2924033 RepID=UPI0020D16609|nr:CBO0543 family protein [Evansella sp. LMS18]UTR10445.1 hypothetical protein MM300_21680 [Evansella sp. LMS18]
MNRKQSGLFLYITVLIGLFLLPFAIYKRSFKDWIVVYLVSCIGNYFSDRLLVSKGYLKYKVRPFKDKFAIHLPFDFIQYPLLLLYFNQWTLNSKPAGILLKAFVVIIPQILIETFAEKKTDLITWRKGWTWRQSFISMFIKFMLCRLIIGMVRKMNTKKVSTLT